MKINKIKFKTIDSTNTWVKTNINKLEIESLNAISAEEQTAGRGRFNRKWLSPKGMNVYTTYHFAISKSLPIPIHTAQIIAVSACKMLINKGFKPKIKWPNDVLIEQKKVGGILCESVQDAQYTHMIVGIGLNVNMPQPLLDTIDQPATSLLVLTQQEGSVEEVLESLTRQFHKDLTLFLKSSFIPFLSYLQEHTAYLNQSISFHDGLKTWQGICRGLDATGNLLVELPNGTHQCFHSGEILFQKKMFS